MIHLPEDLQSKLTLFDSYQSESFLFLNETIAGVEVENMTIRHFLILDGIDCPFIKGRNAELEEIAIFLWVLSPNFSTDVKKRDKFIKEVAKIPVVDAMKGIKEFLKKTFQDAEHEDSREKGHAHFATYLIDLFAREYNWSIQDIMCLPLRVCYQLITAIQERCAKLNGESYSKLRDIDELINKHILKEHKKESSEWHSQNT